MQHCIALRSPARCPSPAGGAGSSNRVSVSAAVPLLLLSNSTDRSTAKSGAAVLRAAAGCAVLSISADGGLLLTHDASNSSSVQAPAALVWRTRPGPRPSAAAAGATQGGRTAAALITLELDAFGRLATSAAAAGEPGGDVATWSNGVSLPFSGPFKLALLCNATWAALVETDRGGSTVWRSDDELQAPESSDVTVVDEELVPDDALAGLLQRVDPSSVQLSPLLQAPAAPAGQRGSGGVSVLDDDIRANLPALLKSNGTPPPAGKRPPPPQPRRAPPPPPAPPPPLGIFPSTPVLSNPINHKPQMVYLDNGDLRLGFDLARGAALSYLAAHSQLELNLVNDWDNGRLVQQSYYGSVDGSVWVVPDGSKPWRWAGERASGRLLLAAARARWPARPTAPRRALHASLHSRARACCRCARPWRSLQRRYAVPIATRRLTVLPPLPPPPPLQVQPGAGRRVHQRGGQGPGLAHGQRQQVLRLADRPLPLGHRQAAGRLHDVADHLPQGGRGQAELLHELHRCAPGGGLALASAALLRPCCCLGAWLLAVGAGARAVAPACRGACATRSCAGQGRRARAALVQGSA
jgi:hypothetical protein